MSPGAIIQKNIYISKTCKSTSIRHTPEREFHEKKNNFRNRTCSRNGMILPLFLQHFGFSDLEKVIPPVVSNSVSQENLIHSRFANGSPAYTLHIECIYFTGYAM